MSHLSIQIEEERSDNSKKKKDRRIHITKYLTRFFLIRIYYHECFYVYIGKFCLFHYK